MLLRIIIVLISMFLGSYLYYHSFAEAWNTFLTPWYAKWPIVFLGAYLMGKYIPELTYWGRQKIIHDEAVKQLKKERRIEDRAKHKE